MNNSRVHTFYVTRHGETAGNLARILLSPEEDILSPGGIVEAGLVGEAFKDVKFTKIYSSPYPRAVNTTEIILTKNNLSGQSFEKDDRLREIYFGIHEGGPYGPLFKDLIPLYDKGISKFDWIVEDAETINDVCARGRSFLEDLFQKLDSSDKDETVLLVCHAAFNMAFFEMLNKSPDIIISNWNDSCGKVMRNATYMKFTLSSKDADSKREMTFFNIHEKSHLNEIKKEDSLTVVSKTVGKPLSGCFQV